VGKLRVLLGSFVEFGTLTTLVGVKKACKTLNLLLKTNFLSQKEVE